MSLVVRMGTQYHMVLVLVQLLAKIQWETPQSSEPQGDDLGVARGLGTARKNRAISIWKCSCQKLATHVQLLVNFLPAGICMCSS